MLCCVRHLCTGRLRVISPMTRPQPTSWARMTLTGIIVLCLLLAWTRDMQCCETEYFLIGSELLKSRSRIRLCLWAPTVGSVCGPRLLALSVCPDCWLSLWAPTVSSVCGPRLLAPSVGPDCWLRLWAPIVSLNSFIKGFKDPKLGIFVKQFFYSKDKSRSRQKNFAPAKKLCTVSKTLDF